MPIRYLCLVTVLSVLTVCRPMRAQDSSQVEDLKKRVTDLENQNRQILQALSELQAKLAQLTPTASTTARAARLAPAAPTSTTSPTAPSAELAKVEAPASTSKPGAPTPIATNITQAQAAALTSQRVPPAKGSGEDTSLGSRLKFYGWLRVDADVDSQRPNSGEAPLYVNPANPVTGKSDESLFSLHPRLTRLGMDFNGPTLDDLGGAKLSGKLETDFENGGSESRQIIRIRHAYFQLNWGTFSILGGQTWDIIAPLYPTVNNDTLMWDAGNIGDRRPQIRADWEPRSGRGTWSLVGGIGLTGAVDALDLTNDGYLDGQESGKPDLQARIGYGYPFLGQQASLGVSTYYGWLTTSKPVVGRTNFTAQATDLDYRLPVARRMSLRGEGWWGRNMSDIRGGAGQGINMLTGQEIRGRGGWSELSVKLARFWSVHPGITTDDPFRVDIPVGGRTRNASWYVGNRLTFGPAFTFGADYIRWDTDYKGALPGIDNRINLFMYYGF